jgi:alpha-tubulin suppressor-like RCC1 family protein
MAERGRGKRFELRVTDIEDPLPDATFGSIGRYVEVARPDQGEEPFVPQRLTLGFDEKQAEHVDLWTLTLFRVDLESREFTPVDSSRVDADEREVTAWVNEPGTYGLIGLPKHRGVLETLRLLDRFGPQLLEERERGEHGLQDRICGLILCADPTPWGGGPTGPGDLCQKCLGLDVSWGRLPERYLWERRPDIPPFREITDDDDGAAGAPSLLGWGGNAWGEIGDGSKTRRDTPVWVVPRLDAKKVVGAGDWWVSGNWTLALGTDGTVWSWGYNGDGQLGDGTFVTQRSTPGVVAFLTNVVDVAAGESHGLAVRSDGSVWSWGRTPPAAGSSRLPVRVAGLSDIVAVAAGIDFSLALRNDGRVFAWGMNGYGQLGDGSQWVNRANAVQVAGLTAVRSIAAGPSSSFAIKSNGAVVAWGAGGTLGDGGTSNKLTPVPVPGLSNVEQVSVGNHGLARTTAGEVYFWGENFYGEAGDGTATGVHLTPVQVPGLHQITGIAAGGWHNLALQGNGTVWAWGSNLLGEIGVGPGVYTQDSPIAVPLPGGRQAVGVGAGVRTSFAIVG